jgi:hypothetical protein
MDGEVVTFEELYDMARTFATTRYQGEEIDYEGLPMCVATDGNHTYFLPMPWTSDQNKHEMLNMLRVVFAAKGITSYAMITEGWMAAMSESQYRAHRGKIEERLDRQEVMTVSAADINGRQLYDTYSINRDGDEIKLEPYSLGEGSKISGRMFELLKDPPHMTEEARQRILKTMDGCVEHIGKPTNH